MPFTPPAREAFKDFSVAGLTDMANVASTELSALTASITPETVTDEELTRMEELQGFVAAVGARSKACFEKADENAVVLFSDENN